MPYDIYLMPQAFRELESLPEDLQRKIYARFDVLGLDPRSRGCEKMKGEKNSYRIREGVYRIVYEIHEGKLMVLVIRIGHRREVYR